MSKDHISKIQPSGHDDEEEDDQDAQPLKQLLDDDRHQEEPCLTPTSSDHKLPSIRSCPSTPRKPKGGRLVYLQKRKLSDLHFFETTRREEVDSFFRSNFDFSTARVKKRCMSI